MRPGAWVLVILLAVLLLVGKLTFSQEGDEKETVPKRDVYTELRMVVGLAADDCWWQWGQDRAEPDLEKLLYCARGKIDWMLMRLRGGENLTQDPTDELEPHQVVIP